MAIQHLSHIGLCVADLAAARRFYIEGLGFEEVHRLEVRGEHPEILLQMPGLDLEVVYLVRDGTCIELLHYRVPGHQGQADARPMNLQGLTHLSLRTDDLIGDLAKLESLGGRALEETRIDNPDYQSQVIFVLDPDGTRIELVQGPGDPTRLPGA